MDFLRLLIGRKRPVFTPKVGFNCQLQPKGFMRLEEEARKFQRLINAASDGVADFAETSDITELRALLRNGVFELEELLKKLPQRQREMAYVLYLQEIRRATCTVHIAVDSLVDQNGSGEKLPDEMFAENPNVLPSWHCISDLYGY